MIGTQLGAYQILEEVGRGGMAVVYRARQETIERDVAVKVILQTVISTPESVERFKREARLVARLEHPHILPLYDFDGAHMPPYLTMRYLNGGTLKELMSNRRLTVQEALHFFEQIAMALDYAHRQGVIHRDIKPSNILIDSDGNAFVSDFGIARSLENENLITKTGAVVGTPEYISPEQALGDVTIDSRTDIYALGAMLYHMLTGELPYKAPTPVAMLMRHVHDPVPGIRALNADFPPALDYAIKRAMAKKPDDRYPTMAEFVVEVSDALRGLSLPSVHHNNGKTTTQTKRIITNTEQNRLVTVLSATAADYFALIEAEEGIETAHKSVEALWQCAETLVYAYGGVVLSKSENRLMALWGAEGTREDDTERAVLAALALQAEFQLMADSYLEQEEPLPLNIGLHTGSVLLRQEGETFNVSGSTINITDKLAENADGRVMISYPVFRVVRGVFDIESGDSIKIRGRKEAVETYIVQRAKHRAFRMILRGVEGVDTRMVGREAELKLMQNAFMTAFEDEETQVITISGGVGMGKSRLLVEFYSWAELRPERFRVFQGRALWDMVHTPYAMLREILALRFQIQDSDPAPLVREKLVNGVQSFLPDLDPETAPLMGALIGFDFADDPCVPKDGAEIARQGRAAMLKFFTALAQFEPVLMMLEDMHYADDATLNFLNDLVNQNRNLRLCIVMIMRERRPNWGTDRDIYRQIDLQPLDKRDTRALVREILQKLPEVPKSLLDLIVERAEGNPYYVEELVKMLIEDRVIRRRDEAWSVEISKLESLTVPASLISLLQSRLDMLLSPERIVLSCGAVFGRIFWASGVEALTGMPDTRQILVSLAECGFLYRRDPSTFAGTEEYAFAQSMLRDVTYDSLVEHQRQAYHSGAARWLKATAVERIKEYIVAIAEHFVAGGEERTALDYLLRAGDEARRISMFDDAVKLYRRAHEVVPDDPEPLVRITQVLVDKGMPVEAEQTATEALELAHAGLPRARALTALTLTVIAQGDYERGETLLNEALPLAREADDPQTLVETLWAWGRLTYMVGRMEQTIATASEMIKFVQELDNPLLEIQAVNLLGISYSLSQDYQKADEYYEKTRTIALKIGSRQRLTSALVNLAYNARARHDYRRAKELIEEALVMTRETGMVYGTMVAMINLSDVLINLGEIAAAVRYLREGLRIALDTNSMPQVLSLLVIFAKVRAAMGDKDSAIDMLSVVKYHPAHDTEARREIGRALEAWGMSENDIPASTEIDLDTMINILLG